MSDEEKRIIDRLAGILSYLPDEPARNEFASILHFVRHEASTASLWAFRNQLDEWLEAAEKRMG